jgi:hypothetical protein
VPAWHFFGAYDRNLHAFLIPGGLAAPSDIGMLGIALAEFVLARQHWRVSKSTILLHETRRRRHTAGSVWVH